MNRTFIYISAMTLLLPLKSVYADKKDSSQPPQTAEQFLSMVTKTKLGRKYYKKDEKVIDFDLKTAIANLKSRMHKCYDVTVTEIPRGMLSKKNVDRYKSTLRWKGKNKVIFALQAKNLSGNQHHSKKVIEPKDGFFLAGAVFTRAGAKKTKIDLYYRGGFMSSIAKKMYTPIFKWSQAKKAKCQTTRKKI